MFLRNVVLSELNGVRNKSSYRRGNIEPTIHVLCYICMGKLMCYFWIWSFHVGDYEEYYILECDAV
jgi:hypothetical protein